MGSTYSNTPETLPIRGNHDEVKRLMKGDMYIGRGSWQRGLKKGRCCNGYKVAVRGREEAIRRSRDELLSD